MPPTPVQIVSMRLTPALLERAYRLGCFPMPDEHDVIGWYQPDPRAVIPLEGFHVSRSLQRKLAKNVFAATFDQDFTAVMRGCAQRQPTWITPEFVAAYSHLHRLGKAHSVEVWRGAQLAGGVYGVHLGGAFFAESMFHTVTDASKIALAKLVERLRERGFALLECQWLTPHLASLGAVEIPHKEYLRRLDAALKLECEF
jgi:leucyl/phenylalanyl-tRNA---protein transferase